MIKKKYPVLMQACMCFISILYYNVSIAQTVNDTVDARVYYSKADSLLQEDKHDASIVLFSKALNIYQKAQVWEKIASCYNKISENQWKDEKFEKSLKSAEKALELVANHLNPDNPEKATAYFNIGNYHRKKWQFNLSISYLKKALDLRQKIVKEDDYEIAILYGYLAVVYDQNRKHEKALVYYKKNKDLSIKLFGVNHQKTSDAYKLIGMGYYHKKAYHKSIENLEKAIEIALETYGENHPKTGYIYVRINNVYRALGQFDKALWYLEKSLPIFLKHNDFSVLRVQYWDMAFILRYQGEYDKSLEYMKKSHNLILTYFNEDDEEIAGSFYRMGVSYMYIKEYDKALECLYKALETYTSTFGNKNPNVSKVHDQLGKIYLSQKKYNEALEQFETSFHVTESIFGNIRSSRISLHNNKGDVYNHKGIYDQALIYFQKSLEDIQNIYGPENFHTSNTFYKIGKTYKRLKQYDKAITYFEKALHVNTRNKYRQISKKNANPEQYYSQKQALQILREQSQTFRYRYQQNGNLQDLARSIDTYEHLEILIHHIRQSYQNYNDKVHFAKQVKEIYQGAIESHILMHQETADQKNIEKAFYYSEKSKANTLKELLVDTDAKSSSGIPKDVLEKEKSLKTEQAFYQSQIIKIQSDSISNTTKIKKLDNKLFAVNRKYDSLIQLLENKFPKYHQLKYENKIIAVSDIQHKLPKKTTLVSFFVTDSTTYAFLIDKNNLTVKELTTPSVSKNITKLNEAIITKHTTHYKTIAHTLYQELIHPINEQLRGNSLIIIPDGSLWHLNFETLLTKKDTSDNPSQLSYLLRDYAISYANSATLLYNPIQQKKQENQQQGCLAFSFTDDAQTASADNMSLATLRGTEKDLPGTRKEIRAISNIIDGHYFFGKEANEANFKKNASQYKILHLALHGKVDNKNPENSKLYFTKSKDSTEDNLLYSHELFALDIPAELAVLSACETGTGKIAKGEGIMSLGNAFQYAGTKSLLLSHWEVHDDTAPELMQYFYKNLRNGMNKSKALQQAKLQYITTTDFYRTAPFFWGGFYLVGDSAPINLGTHSYWYWVLSSLGGVLLIGLILFWRKRRKKRRK